MSDLQKTVNLGIILCKALDVRSTRDILYIEASNK
jgi:hypothetical protein